MMAATMQIAIQGRRILVVEDEYLIADEIAGVLQDAGAEVLGPVPSVANALSLIAAEDRIDGALLDVNVRNKAIWPVVDVLLARGVPLVLATGYDPGAIPHGYAHLARCEKPTSAKDLARALARIVNAPTSDAG